MVYHNDGKSKSLSERALRMKLNKVLKGTFLKSRGFVPKDATRTIKRWLVSLHMIEAEKEIASKITKELLAEYERRLRWIGAELEDEIYRSKG